MTDAGDIPRRRKIWKYLLAVCLAGLLGLAGLAWYITTDAFQAGVRRRLVAELEKVIGGRVELGSFHTSPLRLRVEVRDLTIHGREKPGEAPYAHVDRVVAVVRVISALGFEFGFHSLVLDHPTIHIFVYPDGSSNQPEPQPNLAAKKSPTEQLFKLSAGHLEVRHGELVWNDQTIPFDFQSNDVAAELTYSVLRRRYLGSLFLGKVLTKFQDYRPIAWMAEAHFSLGPDRIDVSSLRVNSGRSHLDTGGSVTDFRNPKIEANYDAQLDMQEFAAITRLNGPRGGVAQAQGQGTWSLNDFTAAGKILLKDFSWRDKSLNLEKVNATSQFSMTPQRLTLAQLDARALGGSVTGNAEISGWFQRKLAGKAANRIEEKGTAQLRFKEVSANELASAIASETLPLYKMNLAGSMNGTAGLRWNGSISKAETSLALDIIAPVDASPKRLPLNARMQAIYYGQSGELEITELAAHTRATRLQAAGRLARNGVLKLSVATSDLEEWQPVLAAFGRPDKIPAVLHGRASFSGTASGILPNVTLTGDLQANDFDTLLATSERLGTQPLHWDRLEGNIQLSPQMLTIRRGALQRGDTRVNFGWTGELAHWHFASQSPFTARLAVHNGDVAEILSLSGYDYPVRGKMSLYLQASGTAAQPQARGRVQVTEADVRGEQIQRFDAGVQLNGRDLRLNHIVLMYGDATVSGATEYDLSTRRFEVDLSGTNFDIGRLTAGRSGRAQLGGTLEGVLHGSGTLDKPALNATLHLRNFTLDRQPQGNFTLQAVTQGAELHVTGLSEDRPDELAFDGNIHLRDGYPASLTLRFSNLNLEALLRSYLAGRLTGNSSASGELRMQGPLRQPEELKFTGALTSLSLDVESMKLHNQGPIEFAVSNRTLQLQSFRMAGEGTDLSADGTVQLAGDRALNLRARGGGSLKLLESFDSAFTSSGTVDVNLQVSGNISKPVMQGRLQITGGAVAYLDLPAAFSEINGSLNFDQNRVQIEKLTAHTGGGLVTFGGNAAWINHQLNFDVTLQEKDVRLRYPPGIGSTADADLHFVGSTAASTLSGGITVTKLSVTPGFDFGGYLARASRSAALPVTNPTLNRIRLDVHITTTPELKMQTAVVRLSGDADLHLRGSAAKPVLLGRAEVLEGQVSFNGTKYELERGEITFSNPVITTPLLDLQATTHVRDYDIILGLNGEPDKLKVTYRSEPPLPEADIITLLALGRTTTESAQLQESGQGSFTQEASSAIISQALNATVSNRAQRLFGVSRIKIDPEGLNSETTLGRGPAVTIEQQVADNLTITYSTSVEQASQQVIQVVYNLPRNISIVAVRDQNGVVSFDVKIRRRKR